MFRRSQLGVSAGSAFVLASSVLLAAPPVTAQTDSAVSSSSVSIQPRGNVDAIVLGVEYVGSRYYNEGTAYWCNDADAAAQSPNCNFSMKNNPLKLPFQETVVATPFTSSDNYPVAFSVTGNCTLGTSAWDPSSSPSSSIEVGLNQDLYVTALAATGQCVMTGITAGGGTLVPGTFTYTFGLTTANQQTATPLPNPTTMRVGQRVRLQGANGIQTNAGQDVSWQVLRNSRRNCRIVERNNGSAVLRATSRGTCRVQATAPGVDNEWNPFTQSISIRVR